MAKITGFFAYSSRPAEIGQAVERAVGNFANSNGAVKVSTWAALDIVGHFIASEVLAGIDTADFLVADTQSVSMVINQAFWPALMIS